MRKYLTQHYYKAFTIELPKNYKVIRQEFAKQQTGYNTKVEYDFFNHFIFYFQAQNRTDYKHLPLFNYLSTFYNVEIVEESEAAFTIELVLNKTLNKNMWLRLKHAVFNQYNALIGFSEVLKEVEEFDITDKLLIDRINVNAREMFKTTQLLMEFEQLRDFNIELKSRMTPVQEYFSSYFRHRSQNDHPVLLSFEGENNDLLGINVDNETFKRSLDLFFDNLNELVDFDGGKVIVTVGEECLIEFESKSSLNNDSEFKNELVLINDFLDKGIDLKHFSNRMFHMIYIRFIAEKLGGKFAIVLDDSSSNKLICSWIFPILENDIHCVKDIDIPAEGDQSLKPSQKSAPQYAIEIQNEIRKHFKAIDGTFILDEWRFFADKLDVICAQKKQYDLSELKQIILNIRLAVDSFDIAALHLIMNNLRQISKSE